MDFAGIQKNSLIDYPGKLSCVIFLSGCNFYCPYCQNPSLVRKSDECQITIKSKALYEFFESRRAFLDGVVITGGEPTLQKNLAKLCEIIKGFGYSIKLDTNGSRPKDLKFLLKHGLVDYIAMDIKTDPEYYDPLVVKKGYNAVDILSSIDTIMELAQDYEFRTTCVKGFVDRDTIGKIAKLIKSAKRYALQKFHKTEMLLPEFFKDISPEVSDSELVAFKSIAGPWVEECLIR
ncbi:anaerobic ribonucleoside-triphosphate reductase activating protein [Thermodesulfobacteriota bacterium]